MYLEQIWLNEIDWVVGVGGHNQANSSLSPPHQLRLNPTKCPTSNIQLLLCIEIRDISVKGIVRIPLFGPRIQ